MTPFLLATAARARHAHAVSARCEWRAAVFARLLSAVVTVRHRAASVVPSRSKRSSSAYAGSSLARWFSVSTTALLSTVVHRSRPDASSPFTALPSSYSVRALTGGSWKKSPQKIWRTGAWRHNAA